MKKPLESEMSKLIDELFGLVDITISDLDRHNCFNVEHYNRLRNKLFKDYKET